MLRVNLNLSILVRIAEVFRAEKCVFSVEKMYFTYFF